MKKGNKNEKKRKKFWNPKRQDLETKHECGGGGGDDNDRGAEHNNNDDEFNKCKFKCVDSTGKGDYFV